MLFAEFRDTGYKFVLLLHIIAVVISLAPAVAHPLMFALEERRADSDVAGLAQRIVGIPSRVYTIALVLAGVLGIGLISMGDPVIGWGDTWIWLSIVIWIAVNGILHALMLPAERAVAGGDIAAMQKIKQLGPVLTVLMLVLLYLMVLKPGGGGI